MPQIPNTEILAMEVGSTFPFPKLPNDVIVEILTWLPVKTLLKFKCVCKSWRALISSQHFVAAHLENSKLDPNFTTHRLLLWNRGNFKQLSANSMLCEPVSEAFDLGSPFQPDSIRQVVVGSCNGVLCLSAKFPIPGNNNDLFRRDLILWNPSTRIRKDLPDIGVNAFRRGPVGINEYGFGYDKRSDDYKVVRFFHDDMDLSESDEVMLQVYSLRNDQWKTVKNSVRPYWEMDDTGACVNGKLYWLGYRGDDPKQDLCVVCFDLEKEEYEILQLPICVKRGYMKWLGEFGGSIAVMCFPRSHSEVWIMDGCRNWAKLVTIPRNESYFFCPELVLYVMNRPVLFLYGDRDPITIIDGKDFSVRYPEIRNSADFRACGAYIESLVSPLG